MNYNLDKLKERFPGYDIGHTINEDGYSDVELLIDGYYTDIWIDDWMLEGNDSHDLEYITDLIKEYLNSLTVSKKN